MKKLLDYLHFYWGCPVLWKWPKDVEWRQGSVKGICMQRVENGEQECKLTLRAINHMTEDELHELTVSIYHSIHGLFPKTTNHRIIPGEDDNEVGFKCTDEEGDRIALTISKDCGVELSINTHMMKVDQFEATHYLLSKHIDLFNLIEAGFAIDKTRLERT